MEKKHLFDEFPNVHRQIRFDFGEGFFFWGRQFSISEEWVDGLRQDNRVDLPEKVRGCNVTVYTGGNYRKVVRLSKDIPTFDSGDREYDRWHDLYLICMEKGPIQGAYVTCGYRIGSLTGFRELVECPEEVQALLD